MSQGGIPAPDTTVVVVAAGSYPAGTKTWAQRALPDTMQAIQAVIDMSAWDGLSTVEAMIQISYDAGATWMTYTAGINAGQANIGNLAIAAGLGSNGLPMTSGRLIQGHISISAPAVLGPAGVTVNTWKT